MKKIHFIILILSTIILSAQERDSDYFTLYKGGQKYLKPIKYILFNPERDKQKKYNDDLFFYIQGQRFKFSNNKHQIDTCSNKLLKKLNFDEAIKLEEKEFIFYKKKVNENNLEKKIFYSMPITKVHLYFKVYIIKKIESEKLIKYEVDWENSHSY